MGRVFSLALLTFIVSSSPAWAQRGARQSITGLFNTSVAFIDSAVPRSQMWMRLDLAYDNNRPTRAEYFQPKGGVPGSRGPDQPETSVDYQELFAYAEYAISPRFSVFLDSPLRWTNPEQNPSQGGIADMNLGFKWTLFTGANMLSTLQFRTYLPTASASGLGTKHVSFEPALLVNYRMWEFLNLEGEFRYWAPAGGTDFAGDLIRYGVGMTYWGRAPDRIWLTPVVEFVGWTVLDGQEQVVHSPAVFSTQSAAGDTIVNVYAGLRMGFGYRGEIYAGYARALTGEVWFKDMMRLEFKWLF